MTQKYFNAVHLNREICKLSSSGGVFSGISDKWFDAYGEKAVIYGCRLDESLKAVHFRACNKAQRDLLRGSKYIASDARGIYSQVNEDLNNGLAVLFSSTPCQVFALKKYLETKNTKTDNLLTVELVCHGVGSNGYFENYILNMEKKFNSKAVSCNFRAKSRPGKLQDMMITFANGKIYHSASIKFDGFYSAYCRNYILRPSCFECPFAKPQRVADICLADNWGNDPKLASSLVIATTQWGLDWISLTNDTVEYEEWPFEKVVQPNMQAPSEKPSDYDEFCDMYKASGYTASQGFLGNNTIKFKLKKSAADVVYKLRLDLLAKKVLKLIKN